MNVATEAAEVLRREIAAGRLTPTLELEQLTVIASILLGRRAPGVRRPHKTIARAFGPRATIP
ncbi:MAG: hypothetical protein M3003_08400, partial [Candidatus Dormibacteraeota bacterium]|nr:hypothetical protein [Candidatus Dormibacteraeota bacterium]